MPAPPQAANKLFAFDQHTSAQLLSPCELDRVQVIPSGEVIEKKPPIEQNFPSSSDQQTQDHVLAVPVACWVQLTPSGEVITALVTLLPFTAQNNPIFDAQQTFA